MAEEIIIRTSGAGWFQTLSTAYREKTPFVIIDDASAGINLSEDNLLFTGLKVGLSTGEWQRVLGCLGVSGIGIVIILAAILDPEPTSKLAILTLGGLTIAISGGGAALYVLTGIKPPKIVASSEGYRASWGDVD
ncbi:MAG: hypothetical protein H6872_03560 [Methylobacteriaceae bacterium]|nr:hypothetical protein [Rhodoblastus sp.]MCC0004248.1 hypothetical protein [Methylobacteriaceae bacterium]